ncbi:MAG: carboxypeptidase regulatory-like domain-containing protein [Patescibacteria group bacterium]|nr:MAG: carboxypeptidase regulatory-like domain-containing protein [Patescibacteria group bacterium]
MKSKGFTLIELLITTVIIGLLSVAASTTYQFVRSNARDARRVADMRTIRNAIEIYYEQNAKYPTAPPEGIVLGSDAGKMISDAGITPYGGERGLVYLQNVPFNVLPYGLPYTYRSLSRDGKVCQVDCPSYEVAFALEAPVGSLAAGPHLLTEAGILGEESETSGVSRFAVIVNYLPSSKELDAAFGTAEELAALASETAAREDVQAANTMVVVPVSLLSILASVSAAFSSAVPIGNAGQVFLAFLAQPLLLFSRRKRRRWGVVYHAGTKVPIDLATVRLLDGKTGRVVATKVTDKDGRFAFAPDAGEYRLEVVKPGFVFPAASLQAVNEDGAFADIYHGTLLHAEGGAQVLTVNVPLDPEDEPLTDVRELLSAKNKNTLRKAGALAGPTLSVLALAITPTLKMLALFALQVVLYRMFKRFAVPPVPKSFGVLHDIDTRKPIPGAVVRVLSLPYHKVLETRLTDAQGRYAFNVGAGLYYLTALKPGYEKTETDQIDFSKNEKPAWIAADLPMRKTRTRLET